MRISKSYTIDAAHILALPYKSGCNRIHGHTYTIEVVMDGDLNQYGMVKDYTTFPAELIAELDHKLIMPVKYTRHVGSHINVEVKNANGLFVLDLPEGAVYTINEDQSSAELIAAHLVKRLQTEGHPVWSVMVSETPKTKAVAFADPRTFTPIQTPMINPGVTGTVTPEVPNGSS